MMIRSTPGFLAACLTFGLSPGVSAQTISFNTDKVLNRIPPIGYNMIAANRGFGIVKEDGGFDEQAVHALTEMGLPVLRFPGGTYANLYEWKRAIGPVESRGGMHGWKMIPDDNRYGPDEAAQLVERTGGQLVIVVNFNQGSEYAADWVEYMNARVGENPNGGTDWAAVRAQNGHPEPYGVKYWEIANEGGNRRIWPNWPAKGDEDGEYLAFSDKVFHQHVIHGGKRSFTSQRLVRFNAWKDELIRIRGEKNESFRVRFHPVQREGFQLRIGKSAGETTDWVLVESLENSGPDDRHFTLDGPTGTVTFGNGTQGRLPPAGQYVYADYTTEVLDGHVRIYDAMKAVDPDIVIADAFFFIRGYAKKDPETIRYDGTQEHMAGETMGRFRLHYGDDVFTDAVAVATGGFPGLLDKRIDTYTEEMGHAPNLFLTEYGIIRDTRIKKVQHSRTITAAIYYALANAAIAKRGRHIHVACINYLANHGGNREAAFDEGFGLMHANALSTRMFSRHFGRNLVESRAIGIPSRSLNYAELPWSKSTSAHEVPKLYCLASIDEPGERAYLMVINTTADETLEATIAGRGRQLDAGGLEAVFRLGAPSPTAVNTREEPDKISLTRQTPPGIRDGSFQWRFPPATVTSFVYRLE